MVVKLQWINSPIFYAERLRLLLESICRNLKKEDVEKASLKIFQRIHKGDYISPIEFKANLSNIILGIRALILVGFIKYNKKKRFYIPSKWVKKWLDNRKNFKIDDEFDAIVLKYLDSLKDVSKNGRSDYEAYPKYLESIERYKQIRGIIPFSNF